MRTTYRKTGEHKHKHVLGALRCVHAPGDTSLLQICAGVLHCRLKKEPFSQLRFKGTLESRVSKPFILPPLSPESIKPR